MPRHRLPDLRTETQDTTQREQEYQAMLSLLRQAPPRQSIQDERYWQWRRRVDAFLATLA